MRNRVNGVFVVSTLVMSALFWSGCSKKSQPSGNVASKVQSQYSGNVNKMVQLQYSSNIVSKAQTPPSNEDIIKAIDESGTMTRADGSLTVVPPVKVVEKGKLNKGGYWPVKVKFKLKYKVKNGETTSPTETTSTFRIFEVKENAGKPFWKAQLGT